MGDEGSWDLFNSDGEIVSSLEKVMDYKYLGLETHSNMRKTTVAKQKKMLVAARRYRGACKYLSRQGPDAVSLSRSLWRNVAMSAITFGVESVLVSNATIDSLDRESARWAKETLSLPTNTPNVVSQVLMGIPSFKYTIYSSQFKFHQRIRELPKERYAHQALEENEKGGWDSPYSKHIYKLRSEIGLISFPPTESLLDDIVSEYCIEELNSRIESLSSLPKYELITKLDRARSAREGESQWAVRGGVRKIPNFLS